MGTQHNASALLKKVRAHVPQSTQESTPMHALPWLLLRIE